MFFIHKLALRQKLLLLIGVLLAVVAVLGATQWKLNQANDAVARAYQSRYTSYQLADELRQSSDDLTRLVRTYVDTGDTRWEQQYKEVVDIRAGKQARPAGYEGIYWDFRAADVAVPGQSGPAVALLDLMKQAGFSDAEMAKLAEANGKSAALVNTEVLAMNLVKGLQSDGKGGWEKGAPNFEKARELVNSAEYHRNKAQVMVPISDFFKLLDARTSGAIVTAQADAARWLVVQLVSGAVLFGLFFLLLYGVFGNIIHSMRRAVQLTDGVAQGDLTQHIEGVGRDEVAQLMNALERMQEGLVQVVSTVRQGSDSVDTASAEIAQGNHDLSARTESQASALEETAASMEQLSSTVRQNADNARQANQLAHSASSVATQGGQGVAFEYHPGDLYFCYQEAFNASCDGMRYGGVLRVEDWMTDIYAQSNFGAREGVCYMVRKGKSRPDLPRLAGVEVVDGLDHVRLARIFNARRACYFFDPYTLYSEYAALCGCIPIVVPLPDVGKDAWTPGGRPGVAYGDDDVENAIASRPRLLQAIRESEQASTESVRRFVSIVREHHGR